MGNFRLGLWLAAYVLGLGLADWSDRSLSGWQGWLGFGLGGVIIAVGYGPWRYGQWGLRRRDWLIAGIIAWLAVGWWGYRLPRASAQEVSQFIPPQGAPQVVTGWIASPPSLTRSDRWRFWLTAEAIAPLDTPATEQVVTGQVYVTVPRTAATDQLLPGQRIQVTGFAYLPRSPQNPGSFDFQRYLARHGTFAGVSGETVTVVVAQPTRGSRRVQYALAQVRSRLVTGIRQGLASPQAELVSGMVLGRQAVNIPPDVQDAFIRAGLAHTLAASGFHVSLLLSVVLGAMAWQPPAGRLGVGIVTLLGYVSLTGAQPSVLRAALMGIGALIGGTLERQIKPLGALVLAGVVLLFVNPLWISSIGLWLSFLATLGLLVSVPTLTTWLGGLPLPIASLLAVPIAASLWVLPLQLFAFGTLSSYSILLNVLTTPFIIVITLGGMISAVVSLLSLTLGGAIASLLAYPVQGLMQLVEWTNAWPGSQVSLGNTTLLVMLGLYGLWLLGWRHPWWRSRHWLIAGLAIALIFGPATYTQATLVETTILSTPEHPAILWRDRGQAMLFTDGHPDVVEHTILPYLRRAGLGRVDYVITPWLSEEAKQLEGWQRLTANAAIGRLYTAAGSPATAQSLMPQVTIQPLPIQVPLPVGETQVTVARTAPLLLHWQQDQQTWLWLPTLPPSNPQRWAAEIATLQRSQALQIPVDGFYWSGAPLDPALIATMTTPLAIAGSTSLDPLTAQAWRDRGIPVYLTGRDGAIQWRAGQPIQAYSSADLALASF